MKHFLGVMGPWAITYIGYFKNFENPNVIFSPLHNIKMLQKYVHFKNKYFSSKLSQNTLFQDENTAN